MGLIWWDDDFDNGCFIREAEIVVVGGFDVERVGVEESVGEWAVDNVDMCPEAWVFEGLRLIGPVGGECAGETESVGWGILF